MRPILLALFVAAAAPLHGQFVAGAVDLPISPSAVSIPDSARNGRSSHWKTGLIIGAVIGVVAGARLADHLCAMQESDVNCLGPSLIGAAVLGGAGGGLGALIGSAFPRAAVPIPAPGGSPYFRRTEVPLGQ